MTKGKHKAKQDLKLLIAETMTSTLGKLKEGMSDKKFARKISKASKLLVEDFKLASPKVKVVKAKKKVKEVVVS